MGTINLEKHPIYNTNALLSSIGDLIKETTGITNIYTNPINAGEQLPRFFIFTRGDIETGKDTFETGTKDVYIDIIYEQDYNVINLYDDYAEMADKISEAIHKNLKYNVRDSKPPYDILVSIPLDAHNIKTNYNQDSMHCQFDLKLRFIDEDVLERYKIKKIDWEVNSIEEEDNG